MIVDCGDLIFGSPFFFSGSQYPQSTIFIPSPLKYLPVPLHTGQFFLSYFLSGISIWVDFIIPPDNITAAVVDPLYGDDPKIIVAISNKPNTLFICLPLEKFFFFLVWV
jgi:hypothetical protein